MTILATLNKHTRLVLAPPGLTSLCVLFALILGCYAILLIQVLSHDYLPAMGDAIVYYLAGAKFAVIHSLHPSFILLSSVNSTFGTGYHGPLYDAINGLVYTLSGQNEHAAIITNFVCLALVVYCIFRQSWALRSRLLIVTLTLLYVTVPVYLVTYMVETEQLLFTCLLALQLISLYDDRSIGRDMPFLKIGLFLTSCLLFSLFRPTYLIWSIGLIPLARNSYQQRLFIATTIIMSLLTPFLITLLYAPFPFSIISQVVDALRTGTSYLKPIKIVLRNFRHNLLYYTYMRDGVIQLFGSHFYLLNTLMMRAALSIVYISMVIRAFKTKDKLIVAGLLIITYHIVLLFTLNNFSNALRLLTPVYFFAIVVYGYRKAYTDLYIQLLLLLLILPTTYFTVEKFLHDRQHTAIQVTKHPNGASAELYKVMYYRSSKQKIIYVLIANDFLVRAPKIMLSLPQWNHNHKMIVYDGNLVDGHIIRKKHFPYEYMIAGSSGGSVGAKPLKTRGKLLAKTSWYGLWKL